MRREKENELDVFSEKMSMSHLQSRRTRKRKSHRFQFGSAGKNPRQVDCNELSCQKADKMIYKTNILSPMYQCR